MKIDFKTCLGFRVPIARAQVKPSRVVLRPQMAARLLAGKPVRKIYKIMY